MEAQHSFQAQYNVQESWEETKATVHAKSPVHFSLFGMVTNGLF